MAGRRKSVGPVNYHELPRKKLQSLCKKHGFPANKTNVAMADALTALLNDPERLASGIDSPAITSRSSYLSSSEIDESPMISPGVDSLPTISESRQEVFQGLRITNLPEIMEIDNASPKAVQLVVKNSETTSLHTSEVTNTMTGDCASEETPLSGSNGREMKLSEKEGKMIEDSSPSEDSKVDMEDIDCSMNLDKTSESFLAGEMIDSSRFGSEMNGIEYSEVIDTMIDVSAECAGPLSESGVREMDFSSENSQTLPDESSRHAGSAFEVSEAKSLACEERCQMDAEPDGTSDEDTVQKSVSTSEKRAQALTPETTVMIEVPVPLSEELKDALDGYSDKFTGTVEVTNVSESWTETLAMNRESLTMDSLKELRQARRHDSTVEKDTDATERLNTEILSFELGETVDSSPLPISVMPHVSNSDLSVSNKDGVRLVVDLNNRGFPVLDMLETDGAIRISSHTSENLKSRAVSQRLPTLSSGFVARTQEEVFGPFKCLNAASLSPKVRRSLGICAPSSFPLPRPTLSSPPRSRNASQNEVENDFSFDVPLNVPVVSPVSLPPPTDEEVRGIARISRCSGSVSEEKEFAVEAESSFVSSDALELTKVTTEDEEIENRSESSSPIAGYVKEIVDLLESNSQEKELMDGPAASRRAEYKQSPLVRSSRIAAEILRASKLGQAKRLEVLAGKRSLWHPALSAGLSDDEPTTVEQESLQSTGSDSFAPDGIAYKTEVYGDAAAQEVPEFPSSGAQTTGVAIMVDDPASPQRDQMDNGDNSFASVLAKVGSINVDGVAVSNSSSNEKAEVLSPTSGVPLRDDKALAEDVLVGNSLPLVSEGKFAEIKYVEIPRPVETNVDCGPISELSWIRKATNLPTPKAQKLNEKVKRPASANVRKFELMERAALNSAKMHGTPKEASSGRCESAYTPLIGVSSTSSSLESQLPRGMNMADAKKNTEVSFLDICWGSKKTPERSVAPLSLRDSNKESSAVILETCSTSPKSPAICLDEILREDSESTGKENLCSKENERLRRHQEEYKIPLTGRSKEKALRAAEMNAAIQREKILKQRRGVEEEERMGTPLKTSLFGRLL
ncbi:hypothetical protein MPTK1_1g15160 [Marchantia polymorpha subsp. ruderalis]|uniref:Uncharacterized protein n=2 Tax=Marchantia polymorpha TaxID=3197 RepID=A0AAF6AQD4_MARPO|nr:hypothetical protein MARPO_0033s0145 [Marchantia polymorpha]BBM98654.1 hypothetical protein Mp_1g15160 [Marchantia polymorpha subsp. ruderalis]|eukprot:PTQ41755.1 hypothetical protein MARPO_0033s0145 [Marchantia polymorpha]